MTQAIVIRGVSKRFGRHTVLDELDLTVESGTVLALLGPNGAGKTTTINILSTLVAPDSGTATVGGFDVVRDREEVKGIISLTGQSAAIDGVLTGEENLRMMGTLFGLAPAESRRRTAELLERFELTESARVRSSKYSGGMRRRLDLAISLLRTPPIVFLDEPTTGLDTRSRQELWGVIRQLVADGTTVLLTTQYLEEADQLADRVAVLSDGRIVGDGTPAELKSRIGGELVVVHAPDGSVLREIPSDGTVDGVRRVLASIDVPDSATVTLRRPSLDDVFLELTGSAA